MYFYYSLIFLISFFFVFFFFSFISFLLLFFSFELKKHHCVFFSFFPSIYTIFSFLIFFFFSIFLFLFVFYFLFFFYILQIFLYSLGFVTFNLLRDIFTLSFINQLILILRLEPYMFYLGFGFGLKVLFYFGFLYRS